MADMPTNFWAGWIAVLTIVSFAGLGWLVFSIYFSPGDAEQQGDGPVWDENLREGSNPAPMWWFWLILCLMVFSVVYLMLYPGLGSYSGALKWSQGGRLQESVAAYEAEFGGTRKLIAEAQIETLASDSSLMVSAQRIFDQNCAACHGHDATGQAAHFPNLTDSEWQWGGSPERIEQTIRHGRTPVMVAWSTVLGDEGVAQMADYVSRIGTADADNHPSYIKYQQLCVGCHGPNGNGNELVGAPSLADDVWLYGGNQTDIRKSIADGRLGEMPAFGERLDDTQIRLLLALLVSKSRPDANLE